MPSDASSEASGSAGKEAAAAYAAYLRARRPVSWRNARRLILAGLLLAFFTYCWRAARVDPERLWHGLPKIGEWLVQAWPPATGELPLLAERTGETIAIAAMGTLAATLLAIPMAILASRNLTPSLALYYPARAVLNLLRGIDSFVFALLFVAAVGLGPFAGAIGVGLHTWGSMAKLYADHIENADTGPMEAIAATGTPRIAAIRFALLPDVLPVLLSTTLFWWEFNVRASTVLGVVGAGGIGQELKNSLDLLDFQRLFTIIGFILVVVVVLDQLSNWARRRLG